MQKHFGEPFPTRHLVQRLKDRNITWAEVVEVIDRPDVTFGPDEKGYMVLQKGDLGVVVSRQGGVITVLLRDAAQWTDEDVRRRSVDR